MRPPAFFFVLLAPEVQRLVDLVEGSCGAQLRLGEICSRMVAEEILWPGMGYILPWALVPGANVVMGSFDVFDNPTGACLAYWWPISSLAGSQCHTSSLFSLLSLASIRLSFPLAFGNRNKFCYLLLCQRLISGLFSSRFLSIPRDEKFFPHVFSSWRFPCLHFVLGIDCLG